MNALYIVEGLGGSRRSRDGAAGRIVAAATRAGWTPSIVALDDVARLVRDHSGEPTRLVLCGGDGLIHRALPLLVETGIDAAVVPVGSGNDFVRSFGIDGAAAIELATAPPAAEPTVGVDILAVSDDADDSNAVAGSVLTAGYSGRVTATANGLRFPPGSAKYTVAALREIGRLKPVEARLTVVGAGGVVERVVEGPLTMFAIGNTGYFGGGMHICPSADPTDGLVDVVAVGPIGRIDFMRWLPRVFTGEHLDHESVTSTRAERVIIETTEPLWADGEELTARQGRTVHVVRAEPGALHLLRPRAAANPL